jgi:hypothetical protein
MVVKVLADAGESVFTGTFVDVSVFEGSVIICSVLETQEMELSVNTRKVTTISIFPISLLLGNYSIKVYFTLFLVAFQYNRDITRHMITFTPFPFPV